ncbi:DUF2971 domain-containing protein [Acinetobacter sp. MD2(2019)]|uniref:DUF2971 domain-containing protein n=1 Tax=Acinetobacter sp. MD2(2019) TaxID=2605273 RepID=UPI002D1F15AE|nr:DUF2971 domain-containing protein [Acinetobacter sp. MD2(2019)]MEB3754123.1 DUF2971 domain-containing protein [Acinetobacter sp. MD2(2019)]
MDIVTAIDKILPEISQEEYFRQFYDIKCDDKFYYIYKHVSFDQDLKVLDIFKKCLLKFTPPKFFNDPFDCVADIIFESEDKTNRSLEISEKMQFNLASKLSVTCFNNDPLSILMWSHYADSHKGFLVEFRIPHPFIAPVPSCLNFLAVKYTNNFPQVLINSKNYFENLNGNQMLELVSHLYLTKSKEWSYEKEFRVLSWDYDSNNFQTLLKAIPPICISSVVLGAKLEKDSNNRKEVIKVIEEFNNEHDLELKFYQAQLMKNSFNLFVPGHPIIGQSSKTMKDFLAG